LCVANTTRQSNSIEDEKFGAEASASRWRGEFNLPLWHAQRLDQGQNVGVEGRQPLAR
jgi:hypothetical protein